MKFGFFSLGEHLPDPVSGKQISQEQRVNQIIDACVLAERAGFSFFVTGEHHGPIFVGTTPPVLLTAVAARTTTLRLRSGTTLIPTLDPVRVAEDYSMLDVISGGRVDIVAGKGGYIEPFHLFDRKWDDAGAAYWEGVDLLLRLLSETEVTWEGRFRTPLVKHTTEPRPLQDPLPIWISLGRSLESPEGAARRGLGVMLGNAFGPPSGALPLIDRYREVWAEVGRDPAAARIGAGCQCHVARTSQEARRRLEPYARHYYAEVPARSVVPNLPIYDFDEQVGSEGSVICGSPDEVVERILTRHELLGHDEQFFQLDTGGLPWELLAESIELLGAEVIPVVQKELASVTT